MSIRFDLTDLRLVLYIAEAASITGGASRANMALASASERIRTMEEALGEVTLAQRRRSSQCLQSLDFADDLTVNTRGQSTCLTHQLLPNLVELRVGDANSRVCAEQQERRNDRASEHDQQVPQRPGLAKCRYRSDPQDYPPGDAEQANGGRQRGRVDRYRAVQRVDAGQVAEQGERRDGAGDAGKHGRSKAMPLETAECQRAPREPKC